MYTEKQFNTIAKVDKYGRQVRQEHKLALQNYYTKKEDKPQLSKLDKVGLKFYDKEGNFEWQGASSSDEASLNEQGEDEMSDMQKSSGSDVDEMTYSDEVSGVWSDVSDPKDDHAVKQSYKQAPDAPEIKGKRLAVTNLDWDSISATDLLVLFTSFCSTL